MRPSLLNLVNETNKEPQLEPVSTTISKIVAAAKKIFCITSDDEEQRSLEVVKTFLKGNKYFFESFFSFLKTKRKYLLRRLGASHFYGPT